VKTGDCCRTPGQAHRPRNCLFATCRTTDRCQSPFLSQMNCAPVGGEKQVTFSTERLDMAEGLGLPLVEPPEQPSFAGEVPGSAAPGPELKPTNPKDAIGSSKLPLHLWPETASALGCLGLLDGALKYGRSNFREIGVRASIYVDAAKRHINKWFEGQENDPDSGLPHLSHALACLAILVDAEAAGKLNDDRMVKGGYLELVDRLTPHVARLKALHADKYPKHYTIADNKESE
jgi:hypothetical protein